MRKRWKEVGLGSLTLLAVVLAVAAFQILFKRHVPVEVGQVGLAAAVLLVYVAAARWIERRRVSEFALDRAAPELAAGLVAGFVLFATVMAVLWALGIYRFQGTGAAKAITAGLAVAVMAAILEEIVFRGILFRLSSKIVGTWGALLFTSALFGLAHLGNRGATLSSGAAIVLEAGVLLGAAYAATRRLWLPIGLHIGWNFTEGSVFGMSVSGNSAAGSAADSAWLRGSLSGPQILTGGAFGPEASIVAVLVCLLLALYLLRRAVRLGRIESPAWIQSRNSVPEASKVIS